VPRISGIDLPRQKRIEIALTYIYGIGRPSAQTILSKAGVDFGVKADNLTDDEVSRIRRVIDTEYKVEGDLRRDVTMSLKRSWTWAATGACGTAGACRPGASAPIPTPAPVKDPAGAWSARRRNKGWTRPPERLISRKG